MLFVVFSVSRLRDSKRSAVSCVAMEEHSINMSLPMNASLFWSPTLFRVSEMCLSDIFSDVASMKKKPPLPFVVAHAHPVMVHSVNNKSVSEAKKTEIAPARGDEEEIQFAILVLLNCVFNLFEIKL